MWYVINKGITWNLLYFKNVFTPLSICRLRVIWYDLHSQCHNIRDIKIKNTIEYLNFYQILLAIRWQYSMQVVWKYFYRISIVRNKIFPAYCGLSIHYSFPSQESHRIKDIHKSHNRKYKMEKGLIQKTFRNLWMQ